MFTFFEVFNGVFSSIGLLEIQLKNCRFILICFEPLELMLSKTKNWPVLFAQWKKISVTADVSNTCY